MQFLRVDFEYCRSHILKFLNTHENYLNNSSGSEEPTIVSYRCEPPSKPVQPTPPYLLFIHHLTSPSPYLNFFSPISKNFPPKSWFQIIVEELLEGIYIHLTSRNMYCIFKLVSIDSFFYQFFFLLTCSLAVVNYR